MTDPETGNHLEDIGDGFIVCVRAGHQLTDEEKQALREMRDFLRMTPEQQIEYVRREREREEGESD